MQDTRARSLVREDPTCRRAAKPVHPSSWPCAQSPCRAGEAAAAGALARSRRKPVCGSGDSAKTKREKQKHYFLPMKYSWNATVQNATELFLELNQVAQGPSTGLLFPLFLAYFKFLCSQKKLIAGGGGHLLYENSRNLSQSGQFSKIYDDKNRKTYRLKTCTNLGT